MRSIIKAGGKASKTDGLRAIRRFEKVNRTAFNPFDKYHQSIVNGCGETESLLRSLKKQIDEASQRCQT